MNGFKKKRKKKKEKKRRLQEKLGNEQLTGSKPHRNATLESRNISPLSYSLDVESIFIN